MNIQESHFPNSRVNKWLRRDVFTQLNSKYLGQSLRRYLMDFLEVLNAGLLLVDLKTPILEVGSGNGYFGGVLKRLYPDRQFIGVDPAPNKWDQIPQELYDTYSLKVSFASVDDEVVEKFFRKCFVILNWPQPELQYDIEAIEKLQPEGFFIRYSSEGAGSEEMLNVLNDPKEDGAVIFGETKYYPVAHFYGEWFGFNLDYTVEGSSYIRSDLWNSEIELLSQFVEL